MNNTVKEQATNVVDKVKDIVDKCKNLTELNTFLHTMHPYDAHIIIRDYVRPRTNEMVKKCAAEDVNVYQEFQDISLSSKRAYDILSKNVTAMEAGDISEQTAKKYYGIILRMIRTLNEEISSLESAINKIEERLGMEQTDFIDKEDKTNDDSTEPNDEQGHTEDADSNGGTCQ